ncbi:MAG: TonB-dependent receptor [Janthinobacterium lividum]
MTRTHDIFLAASVSLAAMSFAAADAQTTVAIADTVTPTAQVTAVSVADADAATAQLSDIVVTGEKHETKLQIAPLAITAISGNALSERNINELADINGFVPGLTVTKSEGAERVIAIRGVGYETAQNPNSQPGVAFHIDGVYIAHVIALNQDLLDVDHIEVLRGPQGTVFGQTSTGGAINVITRKPVLGQFTAEGNISYGNYNYTKAYATLNIPLSPTLALRTSIQYMRHDGYGYATEVPGSGGHYPLDDANNLGAHAVLLWQAADTFSVTLSGQTFDANHNAFEQKCLLCSADPLAGSVNYVSDPYSNPRKVYQDYGGKFRTKTRMAYLTLEKTFDDFAVLKSVTAYQFLNKVQSGDNDRYAYSDYYDNLVYWQDKSSTWTQEVSLASTGNKPLEWVIGGFYLRQRALQDILEYSNLNNGNIDPITGQPYSFSTNSPYQHTSVAGYGQATLHATDDLSLIAGLRYSWDKITAQPNQYFTAYTPLAAKSDAFTGKISAEYRLTPSNMFYVTGSKGYKPTGTSSGAPAIFVSPTFKKETIYAAEVGSKNDFFDKRLRLNASAYYYWYNNFQYTAEDPIPFSGGTANIPHANTYGLELEATAIPVPDLRFDGNISLAKGKFKGDYLTIDKQSAQAIRVQEFAALGFPAAYYYDPRIIAAVLAGAENTNGNKIPKLPGVQGSIGATYTAHLPRGLLTLRGDVVYRGKFNSRIFNVSEFDTVPSYVIGDLYISYAPEQSHFTFSISAANVTNKAGISNKFADPYGSGTTSVEYIDPREVFGTIAFKF